MNSGSLRAFQDMTLLQVIVSVCILVYNLRNHTTLGEENNHDNIWISKGANEAFAHFVEYKNHVLDVGRIGSFLVGFVTECALRCLRHASRISFNIEDPTTKEREITYERLGNHILNASDKFQANEEFHHWSTLVSKLHVRLVVYAMMIVLRRTYIAIKVKLTFLPCSFF